LAIQWGGADVPKWENRLVQNETIWRLAALFEEAARLGGPHLTSSIRKGQKYRCQNPDCGCEMEITKGSRLDAARNPRCGCGAEMKKAYVKPTITTRPMEDSDSSDTVV
jgi:hypothetical protein